jgi:hypothetical protein
MVTPKAAAEQLSAILEAPRRAPRKVRVVEAEAERVPTFGDLVDLWLAYLEKEKRPKASTVQDARNVANAYLLPHFGGDTPLYASELQEFVVVREGREQFEKREVRADTFTTEDVDELRRELLDSHLSPRTVQKVLVLLHGVLKLGKRRKLLSVNPSEDAERVSLEDAGVFNVLEPAEFEQVYRAVSGEFDERPKEEREDDDEDASDALSEDERLLYGAALSTSFSAGLRMGEKPRSGKTAGGLAMRLTAGSGTAYHRRCCWSMTRSTSATTNRTCFPSRTHGSRPSRAYWSTVLRGMPRRPLMYSASRSRARSRLRAGGAAGTGERLDAEIALVAAGRRVADSRPV